MHLCLPSLVLTYVTLPMENRGSAMSSAFQCWLAGNRREPDYRKFPCKGKWLIQDVRKHNNYAKTQSKAMESESNYTSE
ncbi:hypothetical protein Mapa_017254 [Marchantia paleacea]|nr:hypothetical protein Mapa_017254 [Marchantia paleacea]